MSYLNESGIYYIWDREDGNPPHAARIEADNAEDAIKKYAANRYAHEQDLGTYCVNTYPFEEIRTYDCSVEVKTTWNIRKVKS